ncbi:MAG: sulfatase-like hydrolase/transferase [Pirellulales bacterium]|nr:sulfatase-like hydrolase/transferase [Pirellulales bacterium]
MQVLRGIAVALLVCHWHPSSVQATTSDQTNNKPNIVFIFTDDQAPRAVAAAGDSRFITPNIDRIFHEGAHLTNSFVTTPVCSPSRAGLITSRYGTQVGITDWIHPGQEKDLGLDPNIVTWPKLMSQAGYRTGLFGKWHLGTADRFHPTHFGYDTFAGIRSGGCPPKDPTIELRDGKTSKVAGYTCDIFTDLALEFLRESDGSPFLVSLHFRAPHAAWLPVRPEDWEPFENLDPSIPNPDYPDLDVSLIKKRTREYLASVKSVDRNVGRVLEFLDHQGLAENTIVVFTSDHGYNLGEHGVWYKGNAIRALKKKPPQRWDNIPPNRRPNLWDTSLQVPTAIRWPGVITPGTKIDQTFSNLDWFPTLVSMCNLPVPDDPGLAGHDFTPILRGQKVPWDNDLYVEYSMHHGAKTAMRGWRTRDWKYIEDFANPGRIELYDLKNDPRETVNLARYRRADLEQIKSQLRQRILDRMKALDDPASH